MKKEPLVFRSNKVPVMTLNKAPEFMTKEELLHEYQKRQQSEAKLKEEMDQITALNHELELHQIELEIQNREVLESFKNLESLNRKYMGLYDSAPVGFISMDSRGIILELNMTAAKMIGQERHTVIGKRFSRYVTEESKTAFTEFLSSIENSTKTKFYFFDLKGPATLSVEIHGNYEIDPLTLESVIKIAMVDQSHKRRAEVAEERLVTLDQENLLLETFLNTVSHDLRTPLTSSKLCAQILKDEMTDIEKKKKFFQVMMDELDRADDMIKELLDASKTKGYRVPLIMKKCNLGKIAKKCIERMETVVDGKAIFLLRDQGEIIGKWSKDALQRMLDNLLSNAIKYGETDKPITVSLEDHEDSVTMVVHNYGEPILSHEQKKIFAAFHRTEGAKNSETLGWGLGLSFVQNIVERHGGKITVKSNASDGTSFIIVLPKNI